ncbi:hypothetical protein JOQ06_028258, partial [Pogonophryne albipinna]
SLGERGALENERAAEHGEEWSSAVCALYMSVCVLIAVILGEAENDEEDLFESSRARFCYDSAWSYRHLVCLKGKTKACQRPVCSQ